MLCVGLSQAMLRKRLAENSNSVDGLGGSAYLEEEAKTHKPDVAEPSLLVSGGGTSTKYLIVSFPKIRQVAYCKLPDNVWYPLVLGEVGEPSAVAVDVQSARLFVADPAKRVIWWYTLQAKGDGHIATTGRRHAAVQNITSSWLAVSSGGDLYFTGTKGATNTSQLSVYRQDVTNLMNGNSLGAVEVYTKENSGVVSPAVWESSGIAVDAMFVYWGNSVQGTKHGSVVKATRTNVGLSPQEASVEVLSESVNNVYGMAATGTHIFYTSPQGVFGVLKTASTPVTDAKMGLVAAPLAGATSWSPTNIAWDGDSTLYFTETSTGVVYTLPSLNMQQQVLSKHADAPGVFGVATISFEQSGASSLRMVRGWLSIAPFLLALASAMLAGA